MAWRTYQMNRDLNIWNSPLLHHRRFKAQTQSRAIIVQQEAALIILKTKRVIPRELPFPKLSSIQICPVFSGMISKRMRIVKQYIGRLQISFCHFQNFVQNVAYKVVSILWLFMFVVTGIFSSLGYVYFVNTLFSCS